LKAATSIITNRALWFLPKDTIRNEVTAAEMDVSIAPLITTMFLNREDHNLKNSDRCLAITPIHLYNFYSELTFTHGKSKSST
jgi:hypothetical protein